MTTSSLPRLSRLLCLAVFAAAPLAALAVPVATAPVQTDTKIGEANMANSSMALELAKLRALVGDDSLVLDSKFDMEDLGAAEAVSLGNGIWSLSDPSRPGYFALKFGTGSTNATADTFFFRNGGDLAQLVWSNEQVQFLTGGACAKKENKCNIGRLSHYVTAEETSAGPAGEVPEPAGIALLGLGMLAAAGVRQARRD